MTDRVAPKSAKKGGKAKGAAAKKTPGPKLAAGTIKPGIGHNSGQVIPALVKIVDEILASGERMKAEAKNQRDLRNRAKSEFGILAGPLAHEIRLRKMDTDVRVQFESSHKDLKVALGYQPELDFVGAQPTKASVAAQPAEADLAGKQPPAGEPEEGYSVEGDEEGDEFPPSDQEDPNAPKPAKDPLAIPDALKRPKPTDVIEREG